MDCLYCYYRLFDNLHGYAGYVDLIGLVNCLPFLVNAKAVSFDETKTLKIYGEDFANTPPVFQFHVNDNFFVFNDEKIEIDTQILLIDNRVYIPLKPVIKQYADLNLAWDYTSKLMVSKKQSG